MLALAAAAPPGAANAAGAQPWITTWAATPAPRWAEELPAPFNVPETLEGQTVRQIARISVGGDQLRIVLSNEFGTRPVTIGACTVALSAGGDAIDPATIKPVTFGGSATAVIPPGAPLVSDPVDLSVKPLSSVAVSFYLPKKTGVTSVHWDGAQTTYISAAGDKTKDADFKPDSTDKSRLFLSRILTTAKPDFVTPSSSSAIRSPTAPARPSTPTTAGPITSPSGCRPKAIRMSRSSTRPIQAIAC